MSWFSTESVRLCTRWLTQLVEVRVAAVGSWYRADQTGLEECRPLVHQTSLTAHVILIQDKTVERQNMSSFCNRICKISVGRVGRFKWWNNVILCTAVQCGSRWTFPAPGPPPPSHGRRRTPCRHRGFHSPGPRRNQQTLVLVDAKRNNVSFLFL